MQTLNQLIPKDAETLHNKCRTTSSAERPEPQPERVMNRLMDTLLVRYPASFASSLNSDRLRDKWHEVWSIELAGLPPERIGVGLDRLKSRKDDHWPPSAGEFRQLCDYTFEEMGWPSPQDAYVSACMGKFDCDGAFYATKKVGADRLRRYAESATRKPFMEAYSEARFKFLQGECLPTRPAPKQAIEEIPKTPEQLKQEHELGLQKLRELERQLGIEVKDK